MVSEKLSGIKHEEKGLSRQSPLVFHEKTYKEDSFVRMHYHSSYEINVFNNVEGVINIGGVIHHLENEKGLLLLPGTLHSYRIRKSGGSIKVWHLGLHYLQELDFKGIEQHFQDDSFCSLKKGMDTQSAEKVLGEIGRLDTLSRASAVLSLLNKFQTGSRGKTVNYKNKFLHDIITWTEGSFQNDLTLDDAASAVNLSRFHFSRKFKNLTGSTFIEYLNNLRLENSLKYLGDGCSVSQAAELSGFSDVSYYIKRFRTLYDMTPLEYQKKK